MGATKKSARRTLRFYRTNFDIAPPYKVILDGAFIKQGLHFKKIFQEQLPRILSNEEIKIYVTDGILKELSQIPDSEDAYREAEKYKVIHTSNPKRKGKLKPKHLSSVKISAPKSIMNAVGKNNESHYVICTQDVDLRKYFRSLGCVPLIYLNSNKFVLEEPSFTARNIVDQKVHQNLNTIQDADVSLLKETQNKNKNQKTTEYSNQEDQDQSNKGEWKKSKLNSNKRQREHESESNEEPAKKRKKNKSGKKKKDKN